MADDSLHPDPTHPYINAAGHENDLAIQNEVMMAHVCHYLMLHTVDNFHNAPLSTKKQYGLKVGLDCLGVVGILQFKKSLPSFTLYNVLS
jgi:hypothetical protein